LYSFFMGISIAFFVTSSTSIFLTEFSRKVLPLSYIFAGAISYLLSTLYTRLQKRIPYRKILISGLALLAISFAVITVLVFLSNWKGFVFLLFIWTGVLAYIHAVSFWGAAAKIFNLQQGKRLFGLISVGEVISLIISFFSIPLLLGFINTEHLLIFVIVGLIMATGVMIRISKLYIKDSSSLSENKVENNKPSETILKKLTTNKYFMLVFLLAFLPMFSNYFVDYIFNSQLQSEFTEKKVLTSFLGLFFGATSIIELLVKSFVSGRLLNKYGLKLGLLTLPVTLIITVILASVFGKVFGPLGLFFSFTALTRVFMRVSKTSLYDPAFQILYQPVPMLERPSFQSTIEGVPKSLGTIAAGVVLLIISQISFLNIVDINIIFFFILIGWIQIALSMFNNYRFKLRELIKVSGQIINTDIKIVNDTLKSMSGKLFLLLEKINYATVKSMIPALVKSENQNFSALVTTTFINNYEIDDLKHFETINQPINLKEKIAEISNYQNFSIDQIEQYANSESIENRIIASKVAGLTKRYASIKILSKLLNDNSLMVQQHAIKEAFQINKAEIINELTNKMAHSNTAFVFYQLLNSNSVQFLPVLNRKFNLYSNSEKVQIQIIKAIKKIGGSLALKMLREKISYPSVPIKIAAIKELAQLNYSANSLEKPVIVNLVEEETFDILWIMSCLLEIEKDETSSDVVKALYTELDEAKSRLFSMLANLYDSNAIFLLQKNLISGGPEEKGYALEIADMILDDIIKDLTLPILENLPVKATLEKYRGKILIRSLGVKARLLEIVNKNYIKINSYTKALALIELINSKPDDIVPILLSHISNPNLIIAEIAAAELYTIDSDIFYDSIIQFKPEHKKLAQHLTAMVTNHKLKKAFLIHEKTTYLKQNKLWSTIPDNQLAILAQKAVFIYNADTYNLPLSKTDLHTYIYTVSNGSYSVTSDNLQEIKVKDDIFWDVVFPEFTGTTMFVNFNQESLIIKVPAVEFYSLITFYPDYFKHFINLLQADN